MNALAVAAALLFAAAGAAQDLAYEGAPIHYERETTDDPVARLVAKLAASELELEYDARHGWLPSVLDALSIPATTQTLVFSKTSFQNRLISPNNPRALYFGDDVYVGYVPGGDVIELSSVDPEQGPIFYALEQARGDRPNIRRDDAGCLQCHASPTTRGWPGHLIRSVHPDPDGFPILSSGSFTTTPSSPIAERWGGWYVTGDVGRNAHLGNRVVTATEGDRRVAPGVAEASLDTQLAPGRHLRSDSDVVALLVLEHQTHAHNAIARGRYETLRALDYQKTLNRSLGDPPGTLSDSTRRRLDRAATDVVDALLLTGEAPLDGPIRGASPFAAEYAARGPHDAEGRSLFELDLERRLYRHALSPMVYADALERLPTPLLTRVFEQLLARLGADESSEPALAILTATHPTFGRWRASREAAAPAEEPAEPKDG